MKEGMKFGIITYILHKEGKAKQLFSYSPYIAEMDIWMKFADKTLIAAPKISGTPSAIETPYSQSAIEFNKVPVLNFTNARNSLKSIIKIPSVFWGVLSVMRKANHIHLRCPGNISLIGCFLQIFFPKKPKTAKYAGNWDPQAKQPWSYKLQRKILSNTFLSRNIKVLVYGEWPQQPINIKPFFTASFSENEKMHIEKKFDAPFQFLFVGSLVEGKRPKSAIELIEKLKESGVDVKLDMYGDGVLMDDLQKYIEEKSLLDLVNLKGSISLGALKEKYKRAHFVLLPSESEGWPKALAEGMFFGCIPIATPVSCVPWMLGNGSRGILISEDLSGENRVERREWREESEKQEQGTKSQDENKGLSEVWGNCTGDVKKISKLLENREEMKRMSEAAKEWSQQYTLEKFEAAIREVLNVSKQESSSPYGRGGRVG